MSYVYRAFDAEGAALYVGVTENLHQRLKQHAINSAWFVELARFEIDRCDSREAGYALEAAEIARLSPRYNRDREFRPPRRSWGGKRAKVDAALADFGGYLPWVLNRRAEGLSWDRVARLLWTAHGVEISGVTAQKWAESKTEQAA